MKHPRIYDDSEMGRGRVKLGWLALIIFVASFMLSPIRILD